MSELTIREAISEDSLIAEHFYQLWLDNDVSPDSIDANWQQKTRDFIDEARRNLAFQAKARGSIPLIRSFNHIKGFRDSTSREIKD